MPENFASMYTCAALYHTIIICDISAWITGAKKSASPSRTRAARWASRTRSSRIHQKRLNSLNYEGKENPIAKGAKGLGEEVAERCGVPVFYEWEGFTSAEARRTPTPAEGGPAFGGKGRKSRIPKTYKNVDASAAALILTSYLTRQKGA
ncbi:MAG: hypothetical protein UY91_C0027G0001 [Parcubacteria group bacterium GW2011_GWB1_55_9]|nr:MAG: hypothetical protein UY91_C0027G0001 [Parcubacteria group bacterium GW2011_GWB1_55_9]